MSKRAGREFWSRVVAEFERSSGETHAAFAARHGVEKATFERWLSRRRARGLGFLGY